MPSLIKKLSARIPSLPRIPEPESGEEEQSSLQRSAPIVNHNAWGETTVNGNHDRNYSEKSYNTATPHYANFPSHTDTRRPWEKSGHTQSPAEVTQTPPAKKELETLAAAAGWNVFGGQRVRRLSQETNNVPLVPKSPVDREVSRYTHGKTSAPKVRYNRTPVGLTISGDWALKECEKLTTWTNRILKSSHAEQVTDLRKSIGDGTTLVTLIETLYGSTVNGINSDIHSKKDRIENLQSCLQYLDSVGVDLTAIDAEDIADGNLKATLLLVGNIQKNFESNDHKPTPCDPPQSQPGSLVLSEDTSTISRVPSGAVPVMPGAITLPGGPGVREPPLGVSDHPTSPHRRNVMTTEDLIPGIMGKEEVRIRPQSVPPGNIVSTTELSSNGVQQHGVEERRQQMLLQQHQSNFQRNYATRHLSSKPGLPAKPQQPHGLPSTAWSTEGQRPQPLPRGGVMTVEERLRSLITSPSSTNSSLTDAPHLPTFSRYNRRIAHSHHVTRSFDDGELLQVPPPQPRGVASNPGSGAVIYHQRSPSQADQLGLYGSSYIPSRPTERFQGSRAEAILSRQPATSHTGQRYPDRPHSRAGPMGHDNPAYNKSRDTSPVRAPVPSNHHDGAEMRDAWNKLFGGQQNRPPSRNMVPLHSPTRSQPYVPSTQHNDPDATNYVDMSGKYSTPGQTNLPPTIRTSPMGQSSSQGQGSSSQGQSSFSSQFSGGSVQVSPTGVSFQTFGKSGSNPSLDRSPTSPQAIGPASKYPDFGSRPSSAKNKPGGTVSKPDEGYNLNSRLQTNMANSNVNKSSESLNRQLDQPKNSYGAGTSTLGLPYALSRPSVGGSARTISVDESESVLNDMQASIFDYQHSEGSSRSVTPPLPPLSNSDSEPSTPSLSPNLPRTATSMANQKTPDVVTSTTRGSIGDKKSKKMTGSQQSLKSDKKYGSKEKIQQVGKFSQRPFQNGPTKNDFLNGTLSDVRESGPESDLPFDIEDTILTVDSIDTEMQNMHEGLQSMHDKMQPESMEMMKERLSNLEGLYQEVIRIVGAEKETFTTTGTATRRRWSLGSSDTSSIQRPSRKFKGSMTANQRHHHHHQKDIKAINRRFQRLESHVVTLARSVAHLSSELRSHNSIVHELESLRKEVRELKEQQFISNQQSEFMANENSDFDKFRGWVPSLTNPKRINKLTKFFGQEPPLLELFLKKLGYEKFASNFDAEHIGMIELPYMTEERLEKIGIPMGPRLRILQEAQLCFRQENFSIYIV